jgi:hypothetical protein
MIMKQLVFLSFLFFTTLGFSQQPIALFLGKNNSSFATPKTTLVPKDISLTWHFTNNKNFNHSYLLVVYNPMTQMNDHYVSVSNNYYLTNTKSFPIYNFDGGRIDSMSPNGSRDLGSGIVNGLVNMLLKKL